GAKHVYAGQFSADPPSLADLVESERVTVLAGVPTVWIGLLQYLESTPRDFSSVRSITCGGSAVPASLIERFKRQVGVEIVQGWGMTETGPVAALSQLPPSMEDLPESERFRMRAKQGRVGRGVRCRVAAEGGRVLEAAVIGVPHERWSERPLACVVLKPGQSATREDVLAFLEPKFARWWLPDDVVFLEEIPKTSVGKFDKKVLREDFKGHQLPSESGSPSG